MPNKRAELTRKCEAKEEGAAWAKFEVAQEKVNAAIARLDAAVKDQESLESVQVPLEDAKLILKLIKMVDIAGWIGIEEVM